MSFHVRDVVASMVNTLVRNEEVDIGLTGGELDDAGFEVLHAGIDRLVAVFPKRHALARRRRITLADLAERAARADRARHERAGGRRQRVCRMRGCTPEIACEPTYMMTAVAMVRAGLGVTILPASAREVRAEPELVVRPIDDPAFTRPIALIKKRGRTLPPVTETFVAVLIDKLGRIAADGQA